VCVCVGVPPHSTGALSLDSFRELLAGMGHDAADFVASLSFNAVACCMSQLAAAKVLCFKFYRSCDIVLNF